MMNTKRTKKEADSIYEKAIALVEKRNVWFQGHTVRWIRVNIDGGACQVCEMDCLCRKEMADLCSECFIVAGQDGYLKLVINDK